MTDKTNPPWYRSHPSGVECIDLTERMDFNTGNALKYVWRFREKDGKEGLQKALWYVNKEIARRDRESALMQDSSNLAKVMAAETDPKVAMALWYLVFADNVSNDDGRKALVEAKSLIEALIHELEPASQRDQAEVSGLQPEG